MDRVPFKNDIPASTNGQQEQVSGTSNEAKKDILEDGAKDVRQIDSVLGPLDDINYHRMADTLDIDYESRKSPHIQEKIAFLTDWAQQETKSDDRLTQALAIKDLCRRLGLNVTGKEMVTKLHRWVFLDMARKRIELQQQLV